MDKDSNAKNVLDSTKLISDIIGFHSPDEDYGFCSNWYPAHFILAGRQYSSSEQYMMCQKVALGRRYDLVDAIMKTSDPAKVKAYAGPAYFQNFSAIKSVWESIRYGVVNLQSYSLG